MFTREESLAKLEEMKMEAYMAQRYEGYDEAGYLFTRVENALEVLGLPEEWIDDFKAAHPEI